MKKREDRKREAKDRKQYKQFMIDFSCQNASLSKALARHDRRAIRDDNTAASQEHVCIIIISMPLSSCHTFGLRSYPLPAREGRPAKQSVRCFRYQGAALQDRVAAEQSSVRDYTVSA